VRVPLEIERQDKEFRDFNLGQIQNIDEIAYTALVCLYEIDNVREMECSLDYLTRCRILPDTEITTTHEQRHGRLLIHCEDAWKTGVFLDYYVQFDGEKRVTRISEEHLIVAAHRQNPDPLEQLRRYELQNPIWKFSRDMVVERYNQLHNATFGIEELVGARVMLLSYQAEVVARVLADTICRYILADEVGLGKTIEASVILKGLYRRDPSLTVLIIAPAALVRQWQNELDTKFWLETPLVRTPQELYASAKLGRCIIAIEDIASNPSLWQTLSTRSGGLLVVDEAHHIYKNPLLYSRIRQLSATAQHVLILSATPIQRRATEFLTLLSLMNPHKYRTESAESFITLVQAQDKIRRRVAILARDLTEDNFDVDDFEDEMSAILKVLRHDGMLAELVEQVRVVAKNRGGDGGLAAAKEALAYVSENYRIEARVIRNRRAHLQAELPQRAVDTRYSYQPSEREGAALNNLYDYIDTYLAAFPGQALAAEYCRVLLYAASSSPYALLDVLETRLAYLATPQDTSATPSINLSVPAPPRQEAQRIRALVEYVPVFDGEKEQYLDTLQYQVEQWRKEEEQKLQHVAKHYASLETTSAYRLVQVMNALSEAMMSSSTKKVLVFSGWFQTIETLSICLETRYGRGTFALFTSDQDDEQLQANADAFQSNARCRILLCDELGGEGRNFQIADQIIHVDLPWTPGQVEQRIGRVDRLGRKGVVLSLIPFAQGWPEEALFNIWQNAFQLFTHSMSGLEIALEGIQDELVESLQQSSRNGLAELAIPMQTRAEHLREAVEEERYYESAAINTAQRLEFEDISDRYRDGSLLREACSWWASLAGLRQDYDKRTEIVTFSPKMFSTASMKKAQFAQLPNMEEALRRSRRQHTLVVRGTFNRDIAVRREDLIFFAPGSDPWTDAIIANAVESDRGRCCAILRSVPELRGTWRGFELLYTLHVNPRPLYAAGFDQTLLFRSLGFLRSSTIRLLISEQGILEGISSVAWKHTRNRADKLKDIHLGKRDGSSQQIQAFKNQHSGDSWTMQIEQLLAQAQMQLNEELDDYMDELAEEATATFERQVLGLQAASLWQRHYTHEPSLPYEQEIAAYQCVSKALVEGIRHPLRQLESVCYWVLQEA